MNASSSKGAHYAAQGLRKMIQSCTHTGTQRLKDAKVVDYLGNNRGRWHITCFEKRVSCALEFVQESQRLHICCGSLQKLNQCLAEIRKWKLFVKTVVADGRLYKEYVIEIGTFKFGHQRNDPSPKVKFIKLDGHIPRQIEVFIQKKRNNHRNAHNNDIDEIGMMIDGKNPNTKVVFTIKGIDQTAVLKTAGKLTKLVGRLYPSKTQIQTSPLVSNFLRSKRRKEIQNLRTKHKAKIYFGKQSGHHVINIEAQGKIDGVREGTLMICIGCNMKTKRLYSIRVSKKYVYVMSVKVTFCVLFCRRERAHY